MKEGKIIETVIMQVRIIITTPRNNPKESGMRRNNDWLKLQASCSSEGQKYVPSSLEKFTYHLTWLTPFMKI